MAGTLLFKPIEAKLTRDTDFLTKMDPYVKILVGDQEVKGDVCHLGGKYPKWDDHITIIRNHEQTCYVEVMDKDFLSADDLIGVAEIDLTDVESRNVTARWYSLYYKQREVGEILFEIIWTPDPVYSNQIPETTSQTHATIRYGTF